MPSRLSKKQALILDYLKTEIKIKGYPPSIREICKAISLSSTSTVHAHLEALEAKGYIRRSPAKNRSIEILESNFYAPQYRAIPVLGKVSAGRPILAVENIEEYFPLPPSYINDADELFMLRIVGDSMIDVAIHNNDLVLVRKQNTAINGDIVVAMLEDSATVKTYYREEGYIRLQPENPSYSPIIEKEISILGKVIGLFRKF